MSCVGGLAVEAPAPGAHGHYAVLTATPHEPPPVAAVDVVYGPREQVDGVEHLWWQLEVRADDDFQCEPLLQLRGLTREDPLREVGEPLFFARYILRIPATGETLDYRAVRTDRARRW